MAKPSKNAGPGAATGQIKAVLNRPEGLQIDYRTLAELIPYSKNPRTHSDDQVQQIAASIKEFGFTNPILLDGENGVIAGHGRLAATRQLGLKTVPCIELGHLSEAQKRAYIIADNKLALNGLWNEELLRLELNDLRELGANLELTGFDAMELADIMLGKDVSFKEYDESAADVSPATLFGALVAKLSGVSGLFEVQGLESDVIPLQQAFQLSTMIAYGCADGGIVLAYVPVHDLLGALGAN